MATTPEPPAPAGLGNCARCAYLKGGPAATCFRCASRSFERLAANRCDLCELKLPADGECGNPLCGWDPDDRYFRWLWAISMRTGAVARAIDRYKVEGRRAWSRIFGRVLVGYLDANREIFGDYDLIVPSPTYTGPGGRAFDHTGDVIDWAAAEDDGTWPFLTGAIVKTAATTPFRGRTWQQRYQIAETELGPALHIPDRAVIEGRRILVYDDVYTEGLTLRTIARKLREADATEVSQVVLARQPYRGKS
jgi:predicted amidophosphoribosyltransferase